MAQALQAERQSSRRAAPRRGRNGTINLRANAETRNLIDRAAGVAGQNRTEFMLASARIHAQEVLLSQVYFTLGEDDWKALNASLQAAPPPNAALKQLLARTPSWQ